jgi:ketosteroid isomerase-like protein
MATQTLTEAPATADGRALQTLIDKDAIRELVLCYSRAIDRQDIELLRDLYTDDATDSHGDSFDGSAEDYCKFIAGSFPYMPYSGHHVCNHMVSVDGDEGNGEVYALAYHVIPDQSGGGGQQEDFMAVRYIDNYRRCADGKWRFSKRVVTYDMQIRRPFTGGGLMGLRDKDPSYQVCTQPLFQRGART